MTDILHEITIQAPAGKVFDAITTEAGLKGWWTADTRSSGKKGSTATFGFYNKSMVLEMRYDEVERAHHLRWSCVGGPGEWNGAAVAFDLEPAEQGTKVRFRHSGWKSTDGIFPKVNTGWGGLMYSLKKYVESGKPAPMFGE